MNDISYQVFINMKIAGQMWQAAWRRSMAKNITGRRWSCRSLTASSAQKQPGVGKNHHGTQHPLIEWVGTNGGKVWDGLAVDLHPQEGYGLVLTQDCDNGVTLIRLPSNCQLTYAMDSSEDPRLLALINKIPETFWIMRLAMCVLKERSLGDRSAFQPYIDNLPATFPGMPMFFSGEAVKALWYPPMVAEVNKRSRVMFQFHKDEMASLPGSTQDPFGGVTVDLSGLGWAMAAVSSRAFATAGPQAPRSLLPLIDLSNHSFDANCAISRERDGSITMTASRRIFAGEPLHLNYGKLDNRQLLLDYGFTIPNNPYNHVLFTFSWEALVLAAEMTAAADLAPAPWQLERLAKLGLPTASTTIQAAFGTGTRELGRLPSGVDPRVLSTAMILCAASPRDLKDSSPENAPVKAAALGLVAAYLQLMLSTFNVDVAADKETLRGGKLSPEMKIAIDYRVQTASMVHQVFINVLKGMLKLSEAGGPQDVDGALNFALQTAVKRKQNPVSKGFGVKE